MDDALVAPSQPIAEQLETPVADPVGFLVVQPVRVSAQRAEVGCAHHPVVGVYHPDVVAVSLRQGQRFRSVAAKVAPRPLVQLTRDAQTGHMAADCVLGTVVGPGVDDHPRGDERRDHVEHLGDDVCLVADDHVEADRRGRGRRVGHCQIITM
jgi:hypothetical protein